MIIYRKYVDDDNEAIRDFMLEHEYESFPESPGGIAIVAEEDGKIIGFVWALVSKGSECAYINYFLVHNDYIMCSSFPIFPKASMAKPRSSLVKAAFMIVLILA